MFATISVFFAAAKIAKHLKKKINLPPWNADLRDVYVRIIESDKSTKETWFHNGTVGYNATTGSDAPVCGRYVRIQLNVTDSLTICGLEVNGKNGKFFPKYFTKN